VKQRELNVAYVPRVLADDERVGGPVYLGAERQLEPFELPVTINLETEWSVRLIDVVVLTVARLPGDSQHIAFMAPAPVSVPVAGA